MPRFIPLNYQQNSMVVINYLDQLQSGTFEVSVVNSTPVLSQRFTQ
jgi:hypothetical protein